MRGRARPVPAALLAFAALSAVATTGCGTGSSASADAPPVAIPPFASEYPMTPVTPVPDPGRASEPPRPLSPGPGSKPVGKPGRWRVTVYYTLVERFHHGKPKAVRGCTEFHCEWGKKPLGSYPEDFVKAVQIEGSGRITAGPQRGRYLNWSSSVGWWLDDTTRDSAGKPLRPWSTAAADRDVLARGRKFLITDCGKNDDGRRIKAATCAKFRSHEWTVTDVFRPGWGGDHHADIYIGEETGPNFTKSPLYTELHGATLYTR
ncbi:hypothetical protein ACGFNU_18350 [Spirillospora sp. NPDC048911]|uniref:hypothetical protein n=1 Tax=Spirillospora sp. NPDC048911 TaxID=3364527 RepID=UPI0037146D78